MLLSTAIAALVCAGPFAFQAHAQSVTGSGDLNPGPAQSPSWTVDDNLRVGDTSPGELEITDGGTVVNDIGYIAYGIGSTGTVTVSGIDGSGSPSTWTNTIDVVVGEFGTGSLSISSGGSVSNLVGYIGASPGSQGTVSISGRAANGAISTWTNASNLRVGNQGTGKLTVEDGAALNTGAAYIGFSASGHGTAIVGGQDASGNASTWVNTRNLVVGQDGTGTLTVASGGLVQVGSNVTIAASSTATGTLDLVGTAAGRGILETGSVIKGAGSATLNLDGGILRATRDESNFLSGFTNLALSTGGAWFDTNAHDIGIDTAFSGSSDLVKLGLGKLMLTGDSSTFTGTTRVEAGTLAVNGIVGGTMVVNNGRLQGGGTVGATTNAAGGMIAPGNSIGVLTVAGDYTSNGGALEIEAVLGDDSSPADLLLITGNSLLGLAPTLVSVVNLGGAGAPTVDGIKIVEVQGARSDADTFVLNGPAIGGAYRYDLFQHDLASGSNGNWYLRNAGLAPTTPTLENYPVALLGMIDLPTLRQRVGQGEANGPGIATRIEGGTGHYLAASSTAGAHYDSSLFLAQIGAGTVLDTADGSLSAGLTAQYRSQQASVFSTFGDGGNSTEGFGVGGSLTWRSSEGAYFDLQGEIARFSSDLNAAGYALVQANSGAGFAVGLEAGHELVLDESWSVTPQGQLSYASVGFDTFTDPFGSDVSLRNGASLRGRLGLALDYKSEWQDDAGRKAASTVYGVTNLTYEFLDGASVAVSGTDLSFSGQRLNTELGLGGTLDWADGANTLHGELLGSTSFQGSYAAKGTLGFNTRF